MQSSLDARERLRQKLREQRMIRGGRSRQPEQSGAGDGPAAGAAGGRPKKADQFDALFAQLGVRDEATRQRIIQAIKSGQCRNAQDITALADRILNDHILTAARSEAKGQTKGDDSDMPMPEPLAL